MTDRQSTSMMRRAWQHGQKIRAATTKIERLRIIVGWVVAEVSRRHSQHRIDDVADAVLDLVYRLQKRLPLPERAPGAPTVKEFLAPRAARRARGNPPNRRDAA